jgi:hypothetical protein
MAGMPIRLKSFQCSREKCLSLRRAVCCSDKNEILEKLREFKNDSGIVLSGPYSLYA